MAKRQIPPFDNEVIRLRLLDENDLDLTLTWRNQDHIRRWFFHSDIILPEQHAAWFQSYRDQDDDFVFIIEERSRDYRPIGQVAIYNIDWKRRQAEFGRLMIGEKNAAGKGLAKEATKAIMMMVCKTFGFSKIYLEVYANNHPALAIYQKSGFTQTQKKDGIIQMVYSCKK